MSARRYSYARAVELCDTDRDPAQALAGARRAVCEATRPGVTTEEALETVSAGRSVVKEEVLGEEARTKLENQKVRFEVETAEKEAELQRLRTVELAGALEELKQDPVPAHPHREDGRGGEPGRRRRSRDQQPPRCARERDGHPGPRRGDVARGSLDGAADVKREGASTRSSSGADECSAGPASASRVWCGRCRASPCSIRRRSSAPTSMRGSRARSPSCAPSRAPP